MPMCLAADAGLIVNASQPAKAFSGAQSSMKRDFKSYGAAAGRARAGNNPVGSAAAPV